MSDLLFRFHAGSLSDSMKTVVVINSREHMCQLIEAYSDMVISSLSIQTYCYDKRIDWDTHIVLAIYYGLETQFPIGFLNKEPNWPKSPGRTKPVSPDWVTNDERGLK